MSASLSLPLLLRRSLTHRRSRTLAELVALTVSAAVATALLTLYASLDLKLHHQFRAFGANIVITAQQPGGTAFLPPDALAIARRVAGAEGRVVPFAYAVALTQSGSSVVVAGTDMAAARKMNSWWQVSRWPQPSGSNVAPAQALTGVRAQQAVGPSHFNLAYNGKTLAVQTAGTLRTGDAEDSRIYLPLAAFEAWTSLTPTTLEVQATGDAQQIQTVLQRLRRALPGADVHAVHQLVDAEANVVARTRALMLSSLILISLTVAICVLATLTASVFERRRDFAVMKALGATQQRVNLLFLLEAVVLAIAGLLAGYLAGCGIAYLIGEWNFHTSIAPVWRVFPEVALLNLLVALLASAIPMRILRRLEPAALLRGE
ncbi:MAG: ABC transporter permease [Acidobacteriaceae bacterium]